MEVARWLDPPVHVTEICLYIEVSSNVMSKQSGDQYMVNYCNPGLLRHINMEMLL